MAHSAIVGSWFPSGYYGHTRSKCREDFMGEFRHLAKPSPPKKFLARSEDNGSHAFSKHDNRNIFSNSAAYFEVSAYPDTSALVLSAHGRKKVTSEKRHAHLLTWMPQKREFDKSGPKLSVYTQDYHSRRPEPIPQILVKKPMTTFDDRLPITTTYLCTYGKANPNIRQLEKIAAAAAHPPIVRPVTSKPSLVDCSYRDSVAGCLNWQPTRPSCALVSTQTDTCQPNPPQCNESMKNQPQKVPSRTQLVPCETLYSPPKNKPTLPLRKCMDREGRSAYSAPPNGRRTSAASASASLSVASESSGRSAPCTFNTTTLEATQPTNNGPYYHNDNGSQRKTHDPYCKVKKCNSSNNKPKRTEISPCNGINKFGKSNDPCGEVNNQAPFYKLGVGDNGCKDSHIDSSRPVGLENNPCKEVNDCGSFNNQVLNDNPCKDINNRGPCNNGQLIDNPCKDYSPPNHCSIQTLNKCSIETPTMLSNNNLNGDRNIGKSALTPSDISSESGCAALNPSAYCPNYAFPATNWGLTNKCIETD